MKGKLKNLLFALITFLIFQEIIFRLCFPLPEIANFDRANYIANASGLNKSAFYRNSQWYWESELDTNYKFIHELNRYGFRDQEWKVKKEHGKARLLMLGDSFLEGIMAKQSQTISEGFKTSDRHSRFETMNMGIMGVGIDSYLKAVVDAVPIFKPDIVCILLYSNDISDKALSIPRNHLIPEYYNVLKPRLLEIIQLYKKGASIPFRFSSQERPFLPSAEDKNFPWYGKRELIAEHTTKMVEQSMVDGRTNPFKLNQILREQEGLANVVDLSEMFSFLNQIQSKYNTKFMVCYIPARHQVTNYYYQFDKVFCAKLCPESLDMTIPFYNQHQKYLHGICADYQIDFLDFTDAIREKENKSEHLYWNYDDHMKGHGYQMIGKMIYEKLSSKKN